MDREVDTSEVFTLVDAHLEDDEARLERIASMADSVGSLMDKPYQRPSDKELMKGFLYTPRM